MLSEVVPVLLTSYQKTAWCAARPPRSHTKIQLLFPSDDKNESLNILLERCPITE